jgi:RND family efflux transporter MFP subunit
MRIIRWLVATTVLLGACTKEKPNAPAMADMPGMKATAGLEQAAPASETTSIAKMPSREGGADTTGVSVNRGFATRLGITFARAAKRPVRRELRLAGTLAYAEPRRGYVSARVNGWVEHLDADYVGKPVSKGDPLLSLYAPELVSAQEEYLSAKRLGDSSLVAAAHRRLSLWDISDDQIDALDRTGKAQRALVLRAPRSGEIAEKMVTDGQAVHAGDNLFLIADRGRLWVDVALYEMDVGSVRVGTPVELTVNALPGRGYSGRVTFLNSTVDEKTRTLTARVEVENRDGALRPGMYAVVVASPSTDTGVSIPLEAVLPTGTRNLVFVNRGDGSFVPRDVTLGARGDSLVQVIRGLKPGDEVVASATYLLDSESNLAAAMRGLMLQMGMGLNMGGMRQGDTGSAGMDMKGMKMPAEQKP